MPRSEAGIALAGRGLSGRERLGDQGEPVPGGDQAGEALRFRRRRAT